MFSKLVYEPATNPSSPNRAIRMSLTTVKRLIPYCQNVINSIIGGKINANMELLTEPTRDITALRLGMAAARKTVKIKTIKYTVESEGERRESSSFWKATGGISCLQHRQLFQVKYDEKLMRPNTVFHFLPQIYSRTLIYC